ncbi:hypothetical protein L6452_34131 [Arctium lappa]|uniref:Uncharacterized protein n=1 Tax=Arctium lappa TaxID=4217 RepID=A0ACB8YIC7_ARCLA|nr:hypothetical protein L6452_34131 [Arctium lappa]
MDLCGPMRTQSINGKKYILVMIDEFSRYRWLEFLRSKSYAPELIIAFLKKIQVRLQLPVKTLRSDNDIEFKNSTLQSYLISVGISHNFSVAYTSQQNGVVERKNRTLVEAERTMLAYSGLPLYLWAEALATACFTQNRTIKADEGYFIGYSLTSKAYRVYNRRTKTIMESKNVSFDELSTLTSEQSSSELKLKQKGSIQDRIEPKSSQTKSSDSHSITSELDLLFFDAFMDICADFNKSNISASSSEVPIVTENIVQDVPSTSEVKPAIYDEYDEDNTQIYVQPLPSITIWTRDHPLHNIIGDMHSGVQTRATSANFCLYSSFLSSLEPKKASEALCDPDWILAMQDELLQYERNKGSSFDLTAYTDADHAGCKLDRKSTSGSCQFLGDKLVSWISKKQNCVSTSTVEAEHVAAASCCSQVLWMRTQLKDFGYSYQRVPIYCDSKSAIAITANPVQH